MRTYARIWENSVVETMATDGDIVKMFHPSLVWVEVTNITPNPRPGDLAIEEAEGWRFSRPIAPPMSEVQIRMRRNSLLSDSDWLVLRHRDEIDAAVPTSLTQEQYQQILGYRQKLRDMPKQAGYPESVSFSSEIDVVAAATSNSSNRQ